MNLNTEHPFASLANDTTPRRKTVKTRPPVDAGPAELAGQPLERTAGRT